MNGNFMSAIDTLIGEKVVIYTESHLSFLGNLVSVDKGYYVLEELAIYDREVIRVSLEEYVFEAQKDGIQVSVKRMLIPSNNVICLNAIDDFIV